MMYSQYEQDRHTLSHSCTLSTCKHTLVKLNAYCNTRVVLKVVCIIIYIYIYIYAYEEHNVLASSMY